jgi:peptide/nickel transport system substrate-binding protein
VSRRLAFNSAGVLVLACVAAVAATRPHYGGVLRVGAQERIATLDPAPSASQNPADDVRWRVTPLIFENLVHEDGSPWLAPAWHSTAFSHWEFDLRAQVRFHDGTPLTPEFVASALAGVIAGCTARAAANQIKIDCDAAHPQLIAELAMPSAAIVRRTGTTLEGTGPFVVGDWSPGRRLTLNAWEEHWGGRPYVDSIEITFGQSARDQAVAMELGRLDIAQLVPGQVGSDKPVRSRIATSSPAELLALVFARNSKAPADQRVRTALSLAIDRGAIASLLLQGRAEPALGLLPNWISGYATTLGFSELPDAEHAHALLSEARSENAALTLNYQADDPLMRIVAERIALKARDIGLNVQLTSAMEGADAQLRAVQIYSDEPAAALDEVAIQLGRSAQLSSGAPLESVYKVERELLADRSVVPVVFMTRLLALAPRVRNWTFTSEGRWSAADLWLDERAR